MSLPTHLDAYEAELDYFEKALDDTAGLRIKFSTNGEAALFTMRMHQARSLQRAQHRRIYTSDDLRYGRSDFDKLTVRQPREDTEGKWWVYIERTNSQVLEVESLSQIMEAPDA